jgi:hypothetical protein
MTSLKTFYGNVPASYRRWWLESTYPAWVAVLGCDSGGGGILDLPSDTENDELQRVRRFGAAWAWWGVPDEMRDYWWSLDG